jgi:hypothetical protein
MDRYYPNTLTEVTALIAKHGEKVQRKRRRIGVGSGYSIRYTCPSGHHHNSQTQAVTCIENRERESYA